MLCAKAAGVALGLPADSHASSRRAPFSDVTNKQQLIRLHESPPLVSQAHLMLYSPVEVPEAKPHTPLPIPPLSTQRTDLLPKVLPPPLEKAASSPYKTLNLATVSPNVEVDIHSARSSAQRAVRSIRTSANFLLSASYTFVKSRLCQAAQLAIREHQKEGDPLERQR